MSIGVYGFLALGFTLLVLRYLRPDPLRRVVRKTYLAAQPRLAVAEAPKPERSLRPRRGGKRR